MTRTETVNSTTVEVAGTPSPAALAVRAQGLTLTYGSHVAVHDADLELPAGVSVAIIGPNGSGKSTLLSAVAGLIRPHRGLLEVLGGPPQAVRRRIAYVLQATSINEVTPVTVREAVTMGRYAQRGPFRPLTGADRRTVDAAMERLAIADLAKRHITELSAGQRQRVFVAQGLAQDADLLLLDEPATGLDLPTQERIHAVIAAERAAGRTVLVTTHDIADASACDLVVLIATRVVAVGPPEEVLTTARLGEAYGGHVHEMDDGTVVIDDPHHHVAAPRSTGEPVQRTERERF